eukprot:7203333-Prymnesium_polylepis.1
MVYLRATHFSAAHGPRPLSVVVMEVAFVWGSILSTERLTSHRSDRNDCPHSFALRGDCLGVDAGCAVHVCLTVTGLPLQLYWDGGREQGTRAGIAQTARVCDTPNLGRCRVSGGSLPPQVGAAAGFA